MASTQNTYDLIIDKSLLVDPTFEKVRKFTEFFPIKFETINSRKFERLTNSSQILLLTLVSISYRHLSVNITVNDSQLPKFRRLNVVELFSELNDFGYLQCPNIKEYIEKYSKEKKVNTRQKKTTNQKQSGTSENLPDLSAQKASDFISLYCQAFKAKHNANPEIDGKSAGIAKRIIKTLSKDKWTLYLRAFFTMPDALLHKNKHPLNQFELKLQEIAVFAQSGAFTTQSQAYSQDKKVQGAQASQALKEGENF